jgi:hypothetical protein
MVRPILTTETITGIDPLEDFINFSRAGALTVSTGVGRFPFPFPATLISVTAMVNTIPTGANLILDVNKNGTTIFTTQANRPTINNGASATASAAVPNVTAMAAGDYLTVDVDQIGSGVAGSDLTVVVRYRRV